MTKTPPESLVNPAEFTPENDHLHVQVTTSGVCIVTLDYPERRNAMSAPMTAAWERLMGAVSSDPGIRSLVVTGEGPVFCSGGDTGWIGSEPDASVDQLRTRMMKFYRSWLSVRDVPVPVVAALNGPAVGAGACIALAADIRIAACRATFSVPFLRLGMHPGMATTFLLPEVVGLTVARDLLFTGRVVNADRMLELGLTSEVMDDDLLLGRAHEIGEQIAADAPIATRLTKAALRHGGPASLAECLEWEAVAQPVTLATDDLQEGLAAAREKRKPNFGGS